LRLPPPRTATGAYFIIRQQKYLLETFNHQTKGKKHKAKEQKPKRWHWDKREKTKLREQTKRAKGNRNPKSSRFRGG